MSRHTSHLVLPPTGMVGIFQLDAHRMSPGGIILSSRRLAGPFNNLLLRGGLNRMGTSTWKNYCHVGTGTTPPVETDTNLQNFLASSNTSAGTGGAGTASDPPYYAWRRNVYRFAAGVAAGNLTEVGVGWGAGANVLASRALIVDGAGNPITITVLEDEVLDVSYEFRYYPPMDDLEDTIMISGVPYDILVRASRVTTLPGDFGAGWGEGGGGSNSAGANAALRATNVTGASQAYTGGDIGTITSNGPTGSNTGTRTITNAAYVEDSFERTATINWGLGGSAIRCLQWCWGWGSYQARFFPDIPKDGTNVLSLTVGHSWARKVL